MDGSERATVAPVRDRRAPKTRSELTRPAAMPLQAREPRTTLEPPAPVAVTPVSPQLLRRSQMLADGAMVTLGLILALVLPTNLDDSLVGWVPTVAAVTATVVAWLVALSAARLYVARVVELASEEIRRLALAGLAVAAAIVLGTFMVGAEKVSRMGLASMVTIVTALLVVERSIARLVFLRLRASGRAVRRIVILGTDSAAIALADSVVQKRSLGYQVVGFIGNDAYARRQGRVVLGGIDRATEILEEHQCSGALISLNSLSIVDVNRLTRELTDAGLHVALSTGLRDIDITRIRPQGIDGQNLLYVEPTIRTGWRRAAKRTFDIAVAGVGLVATAPFVAVAAALIKLESDGPVFFRQERVGRDGEVFKMIKLRSMYQDAEQRKAELMSQNEHDGPLFKMRNDPRVTRVGRIMRKLSVDEFPQFWNVIRGEMSIVGPRPALPSEVRSWDHELHDRLRVLPGITGMWQVSGRSDAGFDAYKRFDLYYVDNWSLVHDMKIVFRTFFVLLSQRGAS
jgi:exopolysaccharide biosynthesis polyprenyl glycosylphosphotransferase